MGALSHKTAQEAQEVLSGFFAADWIGMARHNLRDQPLTGNEFVENWEMTARSRSPENLSVLLRVAK